MCGKLCLPIVKPNSFMCEKSDRPSLHATNGHEYVACRARASKTEPIEFVKEGNCFIHTSNPEGLQKAADALRSDDAAGLLKQICEGRIYTTCLCFALGMKELYNITDCATFGISYGDVEGTATYKLPTRPHRRIRNRFHHSEFIPGPVRSARNTLMENIDGSK
jgi:hypothetical protein